MGRVLKPPPAGRLPPGVQGLGSSEKSLPQGPDEGRDAVSIMTVGAAACPARPNFIRRTRRGGRLPLEGKLAQLSLRLMRSKLKIITRSWYKPATFDLIRHAKRRDTFPSRGRLFSVPSVPAPIFAALALLPGGRGMPRPYKAPPGMLPEKGRFSVPQKFLSTL